MPVPQTPNLIDSLCVAAPRKRDRSWEAAHQEGKAVYRGVDPKLALQVKQIAGSLQVIEGEVARALLEYALRAYARGDLELNPRPHPQRMRMTLYPREEYRRQTSLGYTPRRPKRDKPAEARWRVITTWRGFSPELKSELANLAGEAGLNVPAGELVTALLRFGLKAYEHGVLKLEPVGKVSGYTLAGEGEA
jgi:hypothetical protein